MALPLSFCVRPGMAAEVFLYCMRGAIRASSRCVDVISAACLVTRDVTSESHCEPWRTVMFKIYIYIYIYSLCLFRHAVTLDTEYSRVACQQPTKSVLMKDSGRILNLPFTPCVSSTQLRAGCRNPFTCEKHVKHSRMKKKRIRG